MERLGAKPENAPIYAGAFSHILDREILRVPEEITVEQVEQSIEL